MAFQALYRRYRPQRFAEVKGQEHVVAALRNAVRDEAVAHAYLFSGPRGTGKTSTARILAKALNCDALDEGEPCGVCESCRAVEGGTSLAVTELDAASNNGVDAIRDLIQRASLSTSGRTKVYIVDEVHMLSNAASNALLKTLEDPPGHVVFVLATTDPHKVLPTIRSRTQHYDFRLLGASVLGDHLRQVAADAGLEVTAAAIDRAVRKGDGSARDALSALDQIVAAGGEGDDDTSVDEIVEGLCERDTARALGGIALACGSGADPRSVASSLAAHLRDALLSLMAPDLVSLPDALRERVADQARRLGAPALVRALDAVGAAVLALPNAPDPRVTLEVALVKVTRPDADSSPGAILERLERLERRAREATTAVVDATSPLADPPLAPPVAEPTTAPARSRPASPPVDLLPSERPGRDTASVAAPAPRPAAEEQAGPLSGGRSSAGSPADAREALAAGIVRTTEHPKPPEATGHKPALGSLRKGSAASPPAPRPPPAPPLVDPTPAANRPSAADLPTAQPESGAPDAALPGIDELALAWTERVWPRLSSVSKSRFSTGRFVEVADGAAVLALASPIMRDKCEEKRPELERMLADHFGRAVPVRLVVASVAPAGAGVGPEGSTPEPDDQIDLADLVDAPADHRTGIDRLTQAFPGAEVLDGE